MSQQTLKRAFQALTGVLIGLALVFWLFPSGGDTPPLEAENHFLPTPIQAPEFRLMSHRGDTIGLHGLETRATAVFFGYTSCPDICPLTLTHLTRTMTLLGDSNRDLTVLFVTVDPQRDTPERMEAYLGAFHPSYLGLTGTEGEIREVADRFGVFFNRVGDGDDYAVDHSARVFIIDEKGEIPLSFPVSVTADIMARDIKKLLGRAAPGAREGEGSET